MKVIEVVCSEKDPQLEQMADLLHLEPGTVVTCLKRICKKLGIHSRTALLTLMIKWGMVKV